MSLAVTVVTTTSWKGCLLVLAGTWGNGPIDVDPTPGRGVAMELLMPLVLIGPSCLTPPGSCSGTPWRLMAPTSLANRPLSNLQLPLKPFLKTMPLLQTLSPPQSLAWTRSRRRRFKLRTRLRACCACRST